MGDWKKFGVGLPNVRANNLKIQHKFESIYVGTWERRVWKAPLKK